MKKLTDALFVGATVFVPGFSGESARLLDELAADPARARGVTFAGVQYPGIGSGDYLRFDPTARQVGFFMSPALRRGVRDGRAEVLGLDYAGIVRQLREMPAPDVVVVQASPPDADGRLSAGICADFPPLLWARARRRVVHLNPSMPRTRGPFRPALSEADLVVEADTPLVTLEDPRPSEVEVQIGEHAASLVRDGDTVQFGIGSVPVALVRALSNHRRLKLHTGMLTEPVRALWESGALDRDAQITGGFALGSTDFYRFVSENPRIVLADASVTHDIVRIAGIPDFVAVNSAVEVDLLGQVNSERTDGKLQAGAGGLPVFATGALLSPGGRSLVCMPSTAKHGAVSRIVPALGQGGLCNLPRHLADVVVTEHGIARLRGLSADGRAAALIAIAAPEHRDTLARAWSEIRAAL
jgi:acyl-CoA hydrolase